MDDLMFRKMSEDRAFCEEILRVILSDPGLAVLECTPQYDATNLQGRSAAFDARRILSSGKFDIFKGGLPLYHVDRVIRENGKTVDNGFEEVYVSAKIRDGSEVSELMEVFVEDNAYNDKFPVTSGIKRRFKKTDEGQEIMCEIIEKLYSEAKAEGRAEGQAHINKLNAMLIDAGRFDDLKHSTTDVDYQTLLIHELLPEEMA